MSSQPVAEVGQCERRARSSLGPRRIPDGTCFRLSQGAVDLGRRQVCADQRKDCACSSQDACVGWSWRREWLD